MGLFSSARTINDIPASIRQRVYTLGMDENIIGRRKRERALGRIVKSEHRILSAVPAGDELMAVVPCFWLYMNGADYSGVAVLTDQRVVPLGEGPFPVSGPSLAHKDIAEVEKLVHTNGHSILNVIGRPALPYSSMRDSANVGTLFYRNTVTLYLPQADSINFVANLLDELGARSGRTG